MLMIGHVNRLKVDRRLDFGVYLTSGEEDVLLPNRYIPEGLDIGDEIEVFVYTDSDDRPIATTLMPKAKVGEYALMEVKDANAIGAFFDWGLMKDLLVPRSEQKRPVHPGEWHVVYVDLDDDSGRVFGSTKITRTTIPSPAEQLKVGEEVDLLVYNFTKLGAQVVIDAIPTAA